MSNTVTTQLLKSYPVFEPNQVLTNIHLNDLRQYLDSEERLTRARAIGTGIIGGFEFEVSADNTTITIHGGAGITTDGYLLATDVASNMVCKTCKPYTKAPADLNTIAGTKFWELIPEGTLGVSGHLKSVNEILFDVGKKGIVLLLEEEDIDIKSCFITNCDDRGIERHYSLKPLIMVVPDSVTEEVQEQASGSQIPDLGIERIRIPATPSPDLAKLYFNACTDKLLLQLQNEITVINSRYRNVFKNVNGADLIADNVPLPEIRNNVFANFPSHMQYFYDFTEDLIVAIEEFKTLAFEINNSLFAPARIYKNYLIAGGVGNRLKIFQRHTFRKVRLEESEREKIEQASFLYKRLNRLALSFRAPIAFDEMRITPSVLYNTPLAIRSIPYYYNLIKETNLYKFWNYDLSFRDKSYQVLSYHNALYNKNPGDMFAQPLNYYHQDKLFLRIEGHVGKTKSQVVDFLLKMKRLHHLPFDVVALKIEIASKPVDPNAVNAKPPLHMPLVQEYRIDEFLEVHPGVAHEGGVPKGGTFIILFEAGNDEVDGVVTGDLSLPYVCVCGKRDVFIKAFPNDFRTEEGKAIDLNVLENDIYDRDKFIQLDFIEVPLPNLQAVDDKVTATTGATIDIHVLANDTFDPNAPITLDFVIEPKAFDVAANAAPGQTVDIQVIRPDNINSGGEVTLDFEV